MRFRTWPVAALGLAGLLLLILVSMLTASRRAQEIYSELDQLNSHHHDVDTKLRRLRSDVNLSGIFVRDYLLDLASEHAAENRQRLEELRRTNITSIADLEASDPSHADRVGNLKTRLDDYWQSFQPLFDWTAAEKVSRSAGFLRREVVPRREAILAIAREIEELNNANLQTQRIEVASRLASFRGNLRWLLGQTLVLGALVALVAVVRLRTLERRADEQRAVAQEAEQRMRQLSLRLVATQEEERKNLSRELHDHVAQVLTALRMELGRIERAMMPDPTIRTAAAEGRRLVDQMFRTVRDLALGLRPSMLDDFGLQPALAWHVRDFTRRYGLNVELDVTGALDAVPERHRTCVYRSVQEALTNCARHARADNVRVAVAGQRDGLDVSIEDDGVGIGEARKGDGLGLRGIEERVRELGGLMEVVSGKPSGTRVRIRLPLETSEAPHARVVGRRS